MWTHTEKNTHKHKESIQIRRQRHRTLEARKIEEDFSTSFNETKLCPIFDSGFLAFGITMQSAPTVSSPTVCEDLWQLP